MGDQDSSIQKALLEAFARSSMTHGRYLFFAKVARKEGLQQVGALFEETALHKLSHSKRFYRLIGDDPVEATLSFGAGLHTTAENLGVAVASERYECDSLYPRVTQLARAAGVQAVVLAFESIAAVSKVHADRFAALLRNLSENQSFKRDVPEAWFCRKCGYVHYGEEAPERCPACLHPQGYFELYAQNW